jgi:hypothetical protein
VTHNFGTAIVTVLTGLALTASASAQFYGGGSNYAPSGNQAFARSTSGQGGGGGFVYAPSVGWGGDTGATPWSTNYGSWITPAPTNDSRDYIALNQAAYANSFMREDLRAKKLQHRRAVFDEMRYERENTPSDEELRQQQMQLSLMRARNNPPEREIWAAVPLNDLLKNIQRTQAREAVIGYSIPLDPDLVKHISVTATADNRGSNVMFNPATMPEWPEAFSGDAFTEDKKKLEGALKTMADAQMAGKTPASGTAKKYVAGIREKLYQNRFQVSSQDYVDGLTFITQLGDTITSLSKPGAKNYLDGTYSAKGDTVRDLVDYMTSKGLTFAKATSGSEPYYTALYQQLVTYELGLNRLVGQPAMAQGRPGTPPGPGPGGP